MQVNEIQQEQPGYPPQPPGDYAPPPESGPDQSPVSEHLKKAGLCALCIAISDIVVSIPGKLLNQSVVFTNDPGSSPLFLK